MAASTARQPAGLALRANLNWRLPHPSWRLPSERQASETTLPETSFSAEGLSAEEFWNRLGL